MKQMIFKSGVKGRSSEGGECDEVIIMCRMS